MRKKEDMQFKLDRKWNFEMMITEWNWIDSILSTSFNSRHSTFTIQQFFSPQNNIIYLVFQLSIHPILSFMSWFWSVLSVSLNTNFSNPERIGWQMIFFCIAFHLILFMLSSSPYHVCFVFLLFTQFQNFKRRWGERMWEERRNEKEKEGRREGVLNEEKLKKEANEGDGRKDGMNRRRSSKDWTGIFLPSPVFSLPRFCYISFPASSDFSYPSSSSPLMISSLWLDWFFLLFFFSTLFTTGFSLDSSVTIKIPLFLSLSLSLL